MLKHFRLTPEIQEMILSSVRAGGHDHVAAEAAGVPREVYFTWLEEACKPRAPRRLRQLLVEVRKAQAMARLRAEIELRNNNPRSWLLNGPGRERPGLPGWSQAVDPRVLEAVATLQLADSPIWRRIVQALEAFPEAKIAVAEALKADDPPLPGRGG
jgi:hypothetical protein